MVGRGGLQRDAGAREVEAYRASFSSNGADRQDTLRMGADTWLERTRERRFWAEDFGDIFAGIGDELELVIGACLMRVDLSVERRVVLGDIRD